MKVFCFRFVVCLFSLTLSFCAFSQESEGDIQVSVTNDLEVAVDNLQTLEQALYYSGSTNNLSRSVAYYLYTLNNKAKTSTGQATDYVNVDIFRSSILPSQSEWSKTSGRTVLFSPSWFAFSGTPGYYSYSSVYPELQTNSQYYAWNSSTRELFSQALLSLINIDFGSRGFLSTSTNYLATISAAQDLQYQKLVDLYTLLNNTDFSGLLGDVSSGVSSVNSNISIVNQTLAAVQSSVDSVASGVAGVKSSVDSVASGVAGVKSSVDDVATGVAGVKSSVDDVATGVSGISGSLSTMGGEQIRQGRKIDDIHDDIRQFVGTDYQAAEQRKLQAVQGVNTSVDNLAATVSQIDGKLSVLDSHQEYIYSIYTLLNTLFGDDHIGSLFNEFLSDGSTTAGSALVSIRNFASSINSKIDGVIYAEDISQARGFLASISSAVNELKSTLSEINDGSSPSTSAIVDAINAIDLSIPSDLSVSLNPDATVNIGGTALRSLEKLSKLDDISSDLSGFRSDYLSNTATIKNDVSSIKDNTSTISDSVSSIDSTATSISSYTSNISSKTDAIASDIADIKHWYDDPKVTVQDGEIKIVGDCLTAVKRIRDLFEDFNGSTKWVKFQSDFETLKNMLSGNTQDGIYKLVADQYDLLVDIRDYCESMTNGASFKVPEISPFGNSGSWDRSNQATPPSVPNTSSGDFFQDVFNLLNCAANGSRLVYRAIESGNFDQSSFASPYLSFGSDSVDSSAVPESFSGEVAWNNSYSPVENLILSNHAIIERLSSVCNSQALILTNVQILANHFVPAAIPTNDITSAIDQIASQKSSLEDSMQNDIADISQSDIETLIPEIETPNFGSSFSLPETITISFSSWDLGLRRGLRASADTSNSITIDVGRHETFWTIVRRAIISFYCLTIFLLGVAYIYLFIQLAWRCFGVYIRLFRWH